MKFDRYIVFLWFECSNPSAIPNSGDSFDDINDAVSLIKRSVSHGQCDYGSVFDCYSRDISLNFGVYDEPYNEETSLNYEKVRKRSYE